jgi:two-component system, NtrC family, response regulator HydG
MQKILVIDDDRDMRLLLTRYLQKHDFEVIEAANGKSALEILEKTEPQVILCDFKLGDMNGNDLLSKIKEHYRHIPVIIITGYGDIKVAVEVMKLGAFDYVTKPLFPDEILLTIKKALRTAAAPTATTTVAPTTAIKDKKQPEVTVSGQYIFGDSIHFQNLLEQINRVGPTNYSVIIYGETGSGKEAIAQEIHKRSARKNKPFVAIDCGALSKELAGSELFGHEKGAFTGALFQKVGSFEIANSGTIFLDEIANLPYDVQVSLLRVVQERKMRRVGGTKDIDLDVRIIVASNEPLWNSAQKSKLKFREDLYHRFNEFSITVPPLRERKEDIKIFSSHFLKLTNQELGKNIKGLTPEVENIFRNYIWYGNLRELKNVIKRATLLTDGEYIDVRTLPFEISNFSKLQFENNNINNNNNAVPAETSEEHEAEETVTPYVSHTSATSPASPEIFPNVLKAVGIDAEYELIVKVLKQVKFNKSKAAKLLNIDRKTLYNKLEQYQLLNEK